MYDCNLLVYFHFDYLSSHYSLEQDKQIVLLLNEVPTGSESPGNACMMIIKADDLPFVSISNSVLNSWSLVELKV